MKGKQFLVYSFIMGVIWYILLIGLTFPTNSSGSIKFFPHCVILSYAIGFNFFGGKYYKKWLSIISCILYILSLVIGMNFAKNYMEVNRVVLMFFIPIGMTGLSIILSLIGSIIQLCSSSNDIKNIESGKLTSLLSFTLGIAFFIPFTMLSYKYIHMGNAIIYYLPLLLGIIFNFLSFKSNKKIFSLLGAIFYIILGIIFYLNTPDTIQALHIYLPIFILPQIILSLISTIQLKNLERE